MQGMASFPEFGGLIFLGGSGTFIPCDAFLSCPEGAAEQRKTLVWGRKRTERSFPVNRPGAVILEDGGCREK
ncbi:MAG: hypothetical protein PWP47_427 [Synergistaceae bacterium]|jgi:hypothetical protein|nr:hypothetical protein [Synergistaceae bacterium]